MRQSINIIITLLISVKLFATEYEPPIIFSKAEFINTSTTRIPFKIIDQLIIVEVDILNKSGNFIIDTGSESLILNSVHFRPSHKYLDDGTQKNGIHQSIENIKVKYLDALHIQNLNLKQLNADIIDLSRIEKVKKIELLGIIGYNILKDFEVFIDMHLNQITLTKIDKDGERLSKKVYVETITDSITFKLKNHTIVLDALVGNKKMKFGLDTAAEYNQLNEDSD
jgi:hypothetical protein